MHIPHLHCEGNLWVTHRRVCWCQYNGREFDTIFRRWLRHIQTKWLHSHQYFNSNRIDSVAPSKTDWDLRRRVYHSCIDKLANLLLFWPQPTSINVSLTTTLRCSSITCVEGKNQCPNTDSCRFQSFRLRSRRIETIPAWKFELETPEIQLYQLTSLGYMHLIYESYVSYFSNHCPVFKIVSSTFVIPSSL